MKDSGYASLGAFVAGMLIGGGGVALLLAPQRGKDLRERLQTYAYRAKDDLAERGKDAWQATVGEGKDYLASGRETMKGFIGKTRNHIEKSMGALQEEGRQAEDSLQGRENKDTSQKAS